MSPRASSRARSTRRRRGQALVETTVVLLFLLFAFFAVFQFVDNFRAKLLCEYAAGRCARSATAGFNDFMVEKTARLATMAAAGECLTQTDAGRELSASQCAARMGAYLECRDEAACRMELDFDYWRDGRTTVVCTRSGSKIVARVTQRRPQFFDWTAWLSGTSAADDADGSSDATITGEATIEAHYPDWMQ